MDKLEKWMIDARLACTGPRRLAWRSRRKDVQTFMKRKVDPHVGLMMEATMEKYNAHNSTCKRGSARAVAG